MTKAERRAFVSRRAEELARTGRFADWQAIEFRLRYVEGYSEARGWLDSHFIRERLDTLCAEAGSDLVHTQGG